MNNLKSCPFCGGKDSIVLCDDEGNLHDESYRESPYSGLGFMLHHAHEENLGCPIASYDSDGGILSGVYIKDCKNGELVPDFDGLYSCRGKRKPLHDPDDFCNFGVKREDG